MSIRLRLTLLHTLLLGLVVAAFAVIVYAGFASQELSQLNYELRLRAEDVQERAFAMPLRTGRDDPANVRHRLLPSAADREQRIDAVFADRVEGSAISAQLMKGSGDVLLRTSDLGRPIPLPAGFAGTALSADRSPRRSPSTGGPSKCSASASMPAGWATGCYWSSPPRWHRSKPH